MCRLPDGASLGRVPARRRNKRTRPSCRLVCRSAWSGESGRAMLVVSLALLQAAACLDVQVEGDLALELHLANESKGRQRWFRVSWDAPGSKAKELVLKMGQESRNVTAAPEVECLYQYPEKEQVKAVLSNMMNELAKAANDFINGVETRREGGNSREVADGSRADSKEKKELKKYSKKEVTPEMKKGTKKDLYIKKVSKEGTTSAVTHAGNKRFKVVNKKQKAFFELIYTNMTEEYSKFSKWTAERVDRAGRDACAHQEEVKQLWRALLEHAQSTLRAAARRTVAAQLAERAPAPRLRARLDQFLAHHLAKVRASQLTMLCDTFQLCYNDLL
uniref:Uncharacterized protein n=1 Tax=Heliothis virescens TaxID=7102 RepID=A0A2A4JVL9_HELVI